MNRMIQERIVSMLHHSGLSEGFWAEALLTAVHITICLRLRLLDRKLCKIFGLQELRIFGCEAYTLVSRDERRKLESRSRKCIFLGYELDGSFGYLL
jgi:hypothetical protein